MMLALALSPSQPALLTPAAGLTPPPGFAFVVQNGSYVVQSGAYVVAPIGG